MCVYRLDMYPEASFFMTLYMNKPLLYSSCFCRLILLWSVVRVVSEKINFTDLCRECNLFLRTTDVPHD